MNIIFVSIWQRYWGRFPKVWMDQLQGCHIRGCGMMERELVNFSHVASRANNGWLFIEMWKITFVEYKRQIFAERCPNLSCHRLNDEWAFSSVAAAVEVFGEIDVVVKHERKEIFELWELEDGFHWWLILSCVLSNTYSPPLSCPCKRIVLVARSLTK